MGKILAWLCFVLISICVATPANSSVGVWTYAGVNYPSQNAAEAAMHAVSPQKALLTVASVSNLNAAGSVYTYTAPKVAPTLGSYGYCPGPSGVHQGINYFCSNGYKPYLPDPTVVIQGSASEADALQYYLNGISNGGCSKSGAPSSDWVPEIVVPAGDVADNRPYDITYNTNAPACNVPQTAQIILSRYRGWWCPQYYSPASNNTVICTDPDSDQITYSALNECPENNGPSSTVGDPCDVTDGDLSQTETDYSGAGLQFIRQYHSSVIQSDRGLGFGWTHNYAAYLVLNNGAPTGLFRPSGHHDAIIATSTPGIYISLSGAAIHVQQAGGQWVATLKDSSQEIYDSTGRLVQTVTPGGIVTTLAYNSINQLLSVSTPFGHTLQFAYNASNQIQTVFDPAGNSIVFGYDSNGNLSTVTYQDLKTRTYLYENASLPHNLTGIIDEGASRFLTVTYDPTTSAVRTSSQAVGAQAVSIVYNTNTATVTDPLGATDTYTFTTDANFAPRVNMYSHGASTQSFAVPTGAIDPQRRVTQITDANGNITKFAYDSDHLTSKTEAYGTAAARTTSYQYLSTNSALPTLTTETLRKTALAYFPGTNNVQTKTVTDLGTGATRVWSYTYNSYGQVLTIDGPRTDVSDLTTYTYYGCTTGSQCGQVNTVTNALGQTTTFNTYNAYGQPLTVTDPNGVVTTLSYDARQRLTSRKVGSETVGYAYFATGLLQTVTLPDSSSTTYGYDGAHRLTDITDNPGNHIHYTLDAEGHRTAQQTYNASGTLKRALTQTYNSLGQLYQSINAAGTAAVTTTFGYDPQGNRTSIAAPLSRTSGIAYDSLNRPYQLTDANSGATSYGYDAQDNLINLTDPRGLQTIYTRNGFGEVTQLSSPDSGTSHLVYDSGGNRQSTTDARGAIGTYTFDALNRPTKLVFSDQTLLYNYDQGANGIGRLTGASDANHSMAWTYDALGRVTGKSQTVGGYTKSVGYSFTNDDLVALVTPSGQTISYTYVNHRIDSIKVNGTTLLSGVTYDPFGAPTGWTWGNGSTTTRSFDGDGNPSQIVSAGTTNGYTVDNAGRITGISDSGLSSASFTYGYDTLDRIISGVSSAVTRGYTWDADGNMSTATGSASISTTIAASSNRISSLSGSPLTRTYSYDAAGNTTGFTGSTFSYNQAGRMASRTVSSGTTNYIYNALGEFIEKTGYAGTVFLVYDEQWHVLGEYASTGTLTQETVYLGDIPVATLRPNGASIATYYVHTDHLGTPRKVTRPSDNTLMWRWDPDTFGSLPPNANPSGQGTFVYNLRFPGQWYMNESALHSNGHRVYDPYVDRYLQSDPIGLQGGVNTYAYARSNAIAVSDSTGLDPYPYITDAADSDTGTIVCDGDGSIISHLPIMLPLDEKCISDCMLIHELTHVSQVIKNGGGNVCRGVPRGMKVAGSSKEQERVAYKGEVSCLQNKLQGLTKCDACYDRIWHRLLIIDDYRTTNDLY